MRVAWRIDGTSTNILVSQNECCRYRDRWHVSSWCRYIAVVLVLSLPLLRLVLQLRSDVVSDVLVDGVDDNAIIAFVSDVAVDVHFPSLRF